jgi:F-type H+-transporting ATPase subunit gamma
MKSPIDIEKELHGISALADITGVFEGIASMRIAQIKNQVLQSQEYFNKLWEMYSQIRVDNLFHYGRHQSQGEVINKELLIAITAEGGFSGDIDKKLVDKLLEDYDEKEHDIIVIGRHGATQLTGRGVSYQKSFKLPSKDQNINVIPIVTEVQKYRSTSVYYQTYVSLMYQEVKTIGLDVAVQQKGSELSRSKVKLEDIISEATYIFEPSTYDVIDHLERSMLNVALSQTILDSKLAQYASRFKAMSSANQKSTELLRDITISFNRAKRAIKDERLKEITNGLRRSRRGVTV